MRIENLKKTFGLRTLFEGASYHFPDGERIALVGANGAGKTTLLNILCGLDTADDGSVVTANNTAVGYLPQNPNPNPASTVVEECQAGVPHLVALKIGMDEALARMETAADEQALEQFEKAETAFRLGGGYSLEARATAILSGLGFSAEDLLKSPLALSGGWRMRLELARLFLREPDFLILDEPTNHLDLPSLVWVEDYLRSFRGTLLFVSHDRSLLNRLATLTLHLAHGRLQPYRGNFDAFLIAREERLLQAQAERDQLRRRREQMERFVERFGAKATKAAQAQSRVKMIARIRDVEDTMAPEGSDDSVFIPIPPPTKVPRIVLRVENGIIGYNKPLARDVNLQIERGTKIAIIGANGIGKSTLLRTIAGRTSALGGAFEASPGVELAYFAQEQRETLDANDTVLNNLVRLGGIGEKAARGMLGSFLFRGDDVFKRVQVLSGGEKSRLGLACVLAQSAGLLLLDEPTNHLDMASVETLAGGLDEYEGTVLFVSHDRTFIDAVCTHVFAMLGDGRSMLFEGKLADYERLAQIANFPNVLKPQAVPDPEEKAAQSRTSAPVSDRDIKELKRQKQKLQTLVATLDGDMVTTREAVHAIEQQMSALPPGSFSRQLDLHKDHTAVLEKLAALEASWLKAAEDLDLVETKLAATGRT